MFEVVTHSVLEVGEASFAAECVLEGGIDDAGSRFDDLV